jgi:hypothetical protein
MTGEPYLSWIGGRLSSPSGATLTPTQGPRHHRFTAVDHFWRKAFPTTFLSKYPVSPVIAYR